MSAAHLRRAGLVGAAALAIALAAAPLAAQTAPGAETEQQEADPSSIAADEDGAVLPFGLEVAGGDEQTLAVHPIGEALPPTERICLDGLQSLTVSASGEQAEYIGPGCLEPRDDDAVPADVYAGSHVWYPLAEDSPGWSGSDGCSAIVVTSSGPSAEAFVRGRRLSADEEIVLQAGDRISLLTSDGARSLTGPGTFRAPCAAASSSGGVAAALPDRRARVAATRGFSLGAAPAPPNVLVATRGTAGALKKFPRGTLIGSPQKVCLAAGDRLTVAARSGARMTFAGPGCGQRLRGADDDNTPAVSPG